MAKTIPIETAQKDLKRLLDDLRLGDAVTLVGAEGIPQALLIPLKATAERPESIPDRDARSDALAQKVSQEWKSDKSVTVVQAVATKSLQGIAPICEPCTSSVLIAWATPNPPTG